MPWTMWGRGWWLLRNMGGDPLQPKIQGSDRDTVGFELDLGAQIIAVVPQPVRREIDPRTNAFVTLTQAEPDRGVFQQRQSQPRLRV